MGHCGGEELWRRRQMGSSRVQLLCHRCFEDAAWKDACTSRLRLSREAP
jgi:hypothetical protein